MDNNKETEHILDQLDAGIFQLIRARTKLAHLIKNRITTEHDNDR